MKKMFLDIRMPKKRAGGIISMVEKFELNVIQVF